MQLTFSQAVAYLRVSESTARRWIRERGLPVHRADERMFVNAVELWEWAAEHRIAVSSELLEKARRGREDVAPISALLERGGVHREVPGRDAVEVLRQVVDRLALPEFVDRSFLSTALAAREAMGSTGIGNGIAIPHVRNPILLQISHPTVSLCLLDHAVDFGAIDGQPVHTLFVVISPTVPMHLGILAKLSLLLRDPRLQHLLQERAPTPRLLDHIRNLEAQEEPRSSRGGAAPQAEP